jgi:hypothetical protein
MYVKIHVLEIKKCIGVMLYIYRYMMTAFHWLHPECHISVQVHTNMFFLAYGPSPLFVFCFFQASLGDPSGLSNSMMGGSFGGHMSSVPASSSASFGNKNHDMVYAIIKQNNEDQGINTEAILAQVGTSSTDF